MRQKLTKEKVDAAYSPLRELLKDEYSLDLKVSDMNQIIEAVERVNKNTSELFREKCDVLGCSLDASSGGGMWVETGYWILCGKHWSKGHHGMAQPEMEPEAIEREKSRSKDGRLPVEDISQFD